MVQLFAGTALLYIWFAFALGIAFTKNSHGAMQDKNNPLLVLLWCFVGAAALVGGGATTCGN